MTQSRVRPERGGTQRRAYGASHPPFAVTMSVMAFSRGFTDAVQPAGSAPMLYGTVRHSSAGETFSAASEV